VNYFPRQLLTADDMTADQQYFLNKLRRHNRYLHGWGVVCGLEIFGGPDGGEPVAGADRAGLRTRALRR